MARRETSPFAEPASERRLALIVALAFVVVGSLWVLFTDVLLYALIHDRAAIARFETAKGWAFVGLTALFLYAVTMRAAARLTRATKTTSAVLESIGDGVLLLGSDRTIAHANPAAVRMLRAENRDALNGMGAQEFSRRFHVSYPDGRLVPPDQFVSQRVFDEQGPIRYKALLYPREDAELVISCTAAAVRSENGTSADIVVSVMHDITATEHMDRLRDELFTETAHALKTPISVIKSASQVLAARATPELLKSTALIERQCVRVERLVENLLALSRIRSNTLQLHQVSLELGPVIEEVVNQARRISNTHNVLYRPGADIRIRADRERLVMMLRNATDAAARASRPGRPVTVRLDRRGADAEIAVAFYPDSANHSSEGPQKDYEFDDLGVGRYVTATIVEAHGGTLTEEADETSTTIRIRLPLLVESS